MAARGIKVNHDGGAGTSYAGWSSADWIDLQTTSMTACGWVRIKGVSSSATSQGHVSFSASQNSSDWETIGGVAYYAPFATNASPWAMRYEHWNGSYGGSDDEIVAQGASFATDEDWFVAYVWDTSDDHGTIYCCIDGGGSLTSASGAAGFSWATRKLQSIDLGAVRGTSSNYGSNLELTNWKVWSGVALSSSDLLLEKDSEAVVHTSGLFAHWKLPSSSDLTDSSGNARTLTAVGTVTDGTMDPVDIQGAAPSTRRIFVVS